MNEALKNLLSNPTASIPDVGRICFGLSRNGSYTAAADGAFPTIKVGKKTMRVPTAPLRKLLGLEAA
jgi:hypothetical protein